MEGNSITRAIVNFKKKELEAIKKAQKKEKLQVNINPESYVAKEIMYQTALLHEIKEELQTIRRDLGQVQKAMRIHMIPEGIDDKFSEEEIAYCKECIGYSFPDDLEKVLDIIRGVNVQLSDGEERRWLSCIGFHRRDIADKLTIRIKAIRKKIRSP